MRGLIGSLLLVALGVFLGRGCERENRTPERVLITVMVDDDGRMTAQPNWPEVLRQGARRFSP